MKLQYLGTAAAEGWPGVFCNCAACVRARELGGKNLRSRSQAILDDVLLLDLPPDTYMHVVQHKLELHKVNTILFTHGHADHCNPVELIFRNDPFGHNHEADFIKIYGNSRCLELYNYVYAGDPNNPSKDSMDFTLLNFFEPFVTPSGHTVTAMEAKHATDQDCYIYLIEKYGKTLLYGHDTGYFPEATWEFLQDKKVDLVSLDCTAIRGKDGANHMGLPDNREVRDRLLASGIAKADTVFVVNHFSHNGKLMHHEIEEEVKDDGFLVSYDGRIVEV